MNTLTEALVLLEEIVIDRDARCAIAGAGGQDESSLLGTRDGLLNLAIQIIRFVSQCDAHQTSDAGAIDHVTEELPDQDAWWSDGLKQTLYQLPGGHPYIVGCYLFKNAHALLTALEAAVKADLPEGVALTNDHEFKKLI